MVVRRRVGRKRLKVEKRQFSLACACIAFLIKILMVNSKYILKINKPVVRRMVTSPGLQEQSKLLNLSVSR
jgi:hypothetical protein